jgi:SpoVK/Ycf46/Vps4 family AAA+-type ATPase
MVPIRVSLDTLALPQRVELLQRLTARLPAVGALGAAAGIDETFIRTLASTLHGFSAADVTRLVSEAALIALNRAFPPSSTPNPSTSTSLTSPSSLQSRLTAHARQHPGFGVAPRDWVLALERVGTPAALQASGLALTLDGVDSALAEAVQASSSSSSTSAASVVSSAAAEGSLCTYTGSVPSLHRPAPPRTLSPSFSALGGLTHPLHTLQHWLVDPLRRAARGEELILPSGLLLHGPPGSGKTVVALSLARACGLPIVTANAASLVNKLVGGSEKAIKNIFDTARYVNYRIYFIYLYSSRCCIFLSFTSLLPLTLILSPSPQRILPLHPPPRQYRRPRR